jgi:hypothetical protein
VVKVAGVRLCGSCFDQMSTWFWLRPAPPWQLEELQELTPRKVESAAGAVATSKEEKKRLLSQDRYVKNATSQKSFDFGLAAMRIERIR